MSFKLKISMLCLLLLTLLGSVGGICWKGTQDLVARLDNVAHVQLPAVRAMGLVDMMHDGLRAVAYRALFISRTANAEQKAETLEELAEMSNSLRSHLESIQTLQVHADTKAAIQAAQPETEAYLRETAEIVSLALSGKNLEAEAKIPHFQVSFSNLETRLAHLGDLIEKDAADSREAGVLLAEQTRTRTLWMVTLGLCAGCLCSITMVWRLSHSLSKVVHTLAENAEQVRYASQQIAESSENLSSSAISQASSLEQTSGSLEQVAQVIHQASVSAQNSLHLSPRSMNSGNDASAVDRMLGSMDDIRASNEAILARVDESNREMTEIVTMIREIANKTKVINEIVFQTKLLSFNASVEAARAGEHGKGFSVVADEVGNLARMSGGAAQEISTMLESSVTRVEGILEQTKARVQSLVTDGKERLNSGMAVARQCAEVLNGIEKNAASSEESASAATTLSTQASSLTAAVIELRREILGGRGTSETAARRVS